MAASVLWAQRPFDGTWDIDTVGSTATGTRVVSKDGQTMTVTTTGTTEKGVTYENTLVFRRRPVR